MAPDPMFEIHPDTALKYGLSEGDMSEIETSGGERSGSRPVLHLKYARIQSIFPRAGKRPMPMS